MGLTKQVLRRPVTTILVVLCLVVFGLSSIFSSRLELIPEMEMPMLIINAIYPGASPDDVEELVTKPIEDEIGTLTGVDSVMSMSAENMSLVMLSYDYGMDMDVAYDDLKKKLDGLANTFPDDVTTPTIIEMDINDTASMTLAINNESADNLYNYVKTTITPELEKLTSVASVELSGGRQEYVRVELIPEKLNQYRLSMNTVAQALGSADFTMPVGSTIVGGKELSVTSGATFDTVELLKTVPITLGNGNIIHMEDVANISKALKDQTGIGRYNGQDTISLSIKKNQDSSDMEVSKDVNWVLDGLKAADPNLEAVVVDDYSDSISSSLNSVFQTMILAVIVSMAVIWLFFGDVRASLIVGTSIPVSILAALILMEAMGFSLNVITMSSLVLGVGMMVDNSIVVLESCFRSSAGRGFAEARNAAVEGTKVVLSSIIGSTLTTCVVFLPVAMISGMSGQLFKPLGYTIVFCMVASLVSAMTLVPLCYTYYRPKERENTPVSRIMKVLQEDYRRIMQKLLGKKALVMLTTVGLLILSFMMAGQLKMELISPDDLGAISISVETQPGLTIEKVDEILTRVEDYVTADENLESYMLSYGASGLSMGGGGASLTAYLKDDRTMETKEVLKKWKREFQQWSDCSITLTEQTSLGTMSAESADSASYILLSTQYEALKAASDAIVEELQARPDITHVHSSLENDAPLIKIDVDPVKAAAEGLSPIQVASQVYMMVSGTEATTLESDGQEISVMVEYPDGEYDTIDQLQGIVLPTMTGSMVALSDIAEIGFEDSPQSILKLDKQYQVTISGQLTDAADAQTKARIQEEVIDKYLSVSISMQENTITQMQNEELGALLKAIGLSIFLVFVVMAAQFESPRFSLMVMTTIPFALIGSFGLLWLADCSISMPSLLGFLMLVGTVVNNGILFVDTANQYRSEMDMDTALIEAGATRMRPIFMTTLTTIVAMIPMAFAIGQAGPMMQGLALVDVGGLTASTILSLLMLPVYYKLMSRKPKPEPDYD